MGSQSPFGCCLAAVIFCAFAIHMVQAAVSPQIASADPADNTIIQLGFLRYLERDTADWLVGMHVAVCEANAKQTIAPGYNFSLFVRSFPMCTSVVPAECVAQGMASANASGFLDLLPEMVALMTPDWWIVDVMVEKARPLQLPIISPKTFVHSDTPHVINLNQRFVADIPHIVGQMLKSRYQCGHPALIVTQLMLTMEPVEILEQAFAFGGYDMPYVWTNVSDAEYKRFIFEEDPDRLCFVMLVTESEVWRLMHLLRDDPRFSTEKYTFFAFNNVERGLFTLNETDPRGAEVFDSFHILKHAPSMLLNTTVATEFREAFAHWRDSPQFDLDALTFQPGERIPARPSEASYFTYVATRYVMEAAAIASAPHRLFASEAVTLEDGSTAMRRKAPSGAELLEVAYTNRIRIGGLVYQPLVRECPDPPLEQICFCNVAARATYTFKVNGSSGELVQVENDRSRGEVSVADSIIPADQCRPDAIDLFNYPIPIALFVSNEGIYKQLATTMSNVLNLLIEFQNTRAIPRPTRPFKLAVTSVPYADLTNENQEQMIRRQRPFATCMAMGSQLNESSILNFFPNADIQLLEDPPLAPYTKNSENILSSLPTFADHVHALAGYYAANAGEYTSIEACALSQAEAELLRKSLNTFQIDISIVVETDRVRMLERIKEAILRTERPFVIVTTHSQDDFINDVYALRKDVAYSRGVVGVTCYDGYFADMDLSLRVGLKGDIFFVSLLPPWWTPTSPLRLHFERVSGVSSDVLQYHPSLFLAVLTFGLSNSLAQQAIVADSTAASLLYTVGTVSLAEISFGPYSNATCSDDIIRRNERDRQCQCRKGPRTFFVHSVTDYGWLQPNPTRTNNYRLTLPTCGVKYFPYIPPPPAADSNNQLTSGAIAGIAVAGSAVLLLSIFVPLFLSFCCFAHKHRHAPSDASKPFTIVFTDIQNSTGLWARAPAAMSESVSLHHTLIRQLISKYRGYEVKTIGDSFMIAFNRVDDAVHLALDIQTVFFKATWPSEIDANYVELISEAKNSHEALECLAPECIEQYRAVWRGIRVRVGVHYGIGDIRKDPVSMGYDYYGTVVNTAARVEGVGHGGQVLLTEEAYQALDPTFVSRHQVQVIDLGPQPLRGLDTQPVLKQLSPMQFSGRRFPPLRLDVEHIVVTDDQTRSDPTGSDTTEDEVPPDQMAQRVLAMLPSNLAKHFERTAGGNVGNTLTIDTTNSAPHRGIDADTILMYYYFLNSGLSAAPEKWRKGVIKDLAKAWNLEVRTSGKNGTMFSLMQLVVRIERAARLASGGRRLGSRRTSSDAAGLGLKQGTADTFVISAGPTPLAPHGVSHFDLTVETLPHKPDEE